MMELGTLSDRLDVTVNVIDQNEVNETPTIDLNGDAPGTNLTQEFATVDQTIDLFPNATVNDFEENDIVSLTLNVTGFGDGVEERLFVNGSEFQATDAPRSTSEVRNGVRTESNYNSDENTIEFTFTNSDPNQPIPASDLQNVLQSIQFRNQGNSDSAIGFEFEVFDASNQSSNANATVLVGDNNNPPTVGGFNEIRLADLTPSLVGPNASFTDNAGHNDAQILINGQNFYQGIGLHPVSPSSFVEYDLNGATEFSAVVGLNDTLFQAGEVVFRAFVDGVEVFNSTDVVGGNVTTDTLALPISFDTTGGTTLRLVVETAGIQGADHAVFANAVLIGPTQVTTISVAESAVNGTLVGTYSGSDVDGDTLTYSLADESGPFAIDADSGAITVADATQLDFEMQSSHSIDVQINDGTATVTHTLQIELSNINEAPTGTDTTISILEDGSRSFSAADFGFSDPEGGELRSILVQNLPSGGTLELNGNPVIVPQVIEVADLPNLVYRPNADANGVDYDAFDFQVRDEGQLFSSDTNTLTFDVTSVNDDPVAADDLGFVTQEDTPITIALSDLLSNDSDIDGDTLDISSVGSNTGTVVFNADDTLTFTPDENFNGVVSLTYFVTDGNGGRSEASFEITVEPVNDDPTTAIATLSPIAEDSGPLTITQADLLVSANDVDGDTLSAIGLTITSGSGTLVDNLDGTWDYTPDANDDSGVSFSYDVTDGNATVANTATLDITPVNNAPVAADDSFASLENNSLIISTSDLLANDSDVDGDTLTVNFTPISGPANGTLSVNSVGSFSYTPDADFNGTDSFTYEITDGNGLTSTAVVNITVTPVNDTPTISPITLTSIAEDSGTITITQNDLLTSANDVDGDVLTATGLTITSGSGTLVDNGDGTWSFTPDANDDSSVSFSYNVTDGTVNVANTATLDITPVNDDPTASPVTLTPVAEDSGTVTITQADLLANATDIDGDTISATQLTITSGNGTLIDNGDGTWSFTPDTNDDSVVSFSYNVTDGTVTVANTATLDITPVNDDPIAVADDFTVEEDQTFETTLGLNDLLQNDSDVDSDTLTVNTVPISGPSNGSLTLNSDGTFTYTPDADFSGSDSFTYEVIDGNGGRAQAIVNLSIDPVNDSPSILLTDLIVSLEENTNTTDSIRVANIAIVDDNLGTNDLSLSGADASNFEIVGDELHVWRGRI